jgi:hypothetical protein
MSKAGVQAKEMQGKENDIDLDDVEVKMGIHASHFHAMLFVFSRIYFFLPSGLLGKAWRARS